MTYKYNCRGKIIEVFRYSDDFNKTVTVYNSEKAKEYERTIREDERGEFFTWDKQKIYLDDWIKTSMKELKEKIENGERVKSDDMCQAILSDGVNNVRFIVPLGVTCCAGFFVDASKTKEVVCKVSEERFNRKVAQNYKIVLVPVEPDDSVASCEDYYATDLLSLIEEGVIKIVV